MSGVQIPPARTSTHGQQLIWLGQCLHPDVPLYNMVLAFEIGGAIDELHFERAVRVVIERSDALRTVVRELEGAPLLDSAAVPTPVVENIDLSSATDPDAALAKWLLERGGRLFDLRERLYDTALIRLGPRRFLWYLNQHHLITDGWSTALVYRSVADAYARSLTGTLDELPELPRYADYVAHERSFRASPAFQRVRDYWAGRLATPIQPIQLYGKRAARQTTATERVTRDLGASRSDLLRGFAATRATGMLDRHVSTFNVLTTALFAWLYRVSGQTRLTIGTPSHNRPSVAFKNTIGLFIEMLPYTIDIHENDTFDSLFEKVRVETTAMLRHAQPGASSAEVNRAFNVVLNYVHASFPSFAGMPVRSEWVHPGHGDAAHHLRLQVHDFDETGRLVLHFDCNRDLFERAEREAAADHFVHLLDAYLARPDRPIRSAPLLSPVETLRVLDAVNSASPPSVHDTVLDLFERQVARTPDAIAVVDGAARLTYAQLRDRAARLATRLRAQGVTAETLVAVDAQRSVEAVVAILGVLGAGAAYVPLSPDDPADRLRSILDDAQPGLLLSDETGRWGKHRIPVVGLQDDAGDAGSSGQLTRPSMHDAAYVLYTSGSTGRPKGVVIEHGSLAHYISWARELYAGTAAVSMPLFTSLSFDLTVTSLFLPLVCGGTVQIYRGDDGEPALLRVLDDDSVDIIKLTPSHLALLRGRTYRGHVRSLILGGEELRTEQALEALRALGDVAVFNEYGPTEATVGCMIHRFDPGRDRGAAVPIGRPGATARLALLDGGRNVVPPGVTGEIAVGGPCLARGYLYRGDLTDERFIADPLRPGERIYLTGDLGRWRSDGTMEYLGRADRQVKVSGVRVEPAEVETAMLAHPGIEDAVVAALHISAIADTPVQLCTRCGIAASCPGVSFDDAGVCHLCRGFENYRERVRLYFRTLEDLEDRIRLARGRRRAEYDCLMLLSGGKDSTYALCRLVEMGASVMAFTLDNGYISGGAKTNIRRVTEQLGVPHVFGTTPSMNAIFVDSLKRHSNVCNGCFKTLYTLGARLAREKGIPLVVTGLSRGQFFETRLTEELFLGDSARADHIDATVLEARKAYHRVPDAVAELLDTRDFQQDDIFAEIEFVDFYRYCDVGLDEMLAYLGERVPWIRPSDTGRSTNCRINQVGIFVHTRERGFHNYALPYSWDVRMGHKERAAALAELDDEIDPVEVQRILREIGYEGPVGSPESGGSSELVGYYVGQPLEPAVLRSHLGTRLPQTMIPQRFVRLERVPRSASGKVDREALPRPDDRRPALPTAFIAPRSPVEERIAAIWCDVLGLERVGVEDAFLDLGGNSLRAIQIISRVNDAFQVDLALRSAFEASTVTALAQLVEDAVLAEIRELPESEAERLAGGVS